MHTKIIRTLIVLLFILNLAYTESFSQNGPPPWAPAHGYRAKTRHIYFPDHNFYFDLHKNIFLHLVNGVWTSVPQVPIPGLNLKSLTQIELDFDGNDPFRFNDDHKIKYKSNNGNKGNKGPKNKGGNGSGNGNGKGKKK
ncbi:MAG: hypothetical protein ACK40G_05220 [Cytophagaceae bacterium]